MAEVSSDVRRVVIVGGGFGGLEAAKVLAWTPVRVTLVDRRNYHVFQPLLYQVATASLSPGDISGPIRAVLRRQKNCEVVLGEVTGVDVAGKRVLMGDGAALGYDYLILAAGATHAYFGHDEWAGLAPGLKGIEDATEMRRRILLAFEAAELEGNEEARRATLTFGIVGAGPTGVELAGAIKEIAGRTLPKDYRHIDTRTTRVLLFEGGDSVLPTFSKASQARALRALGRMGVEVHLKALVTKVTREGVNVGEDFFPVRNVFWAAGVKASGLGAMLGAPMDRAGRVLVDADLSVPGHPEVFVIGDLAAVKSNGKMVPGVAPAAIQMGRFVGRAIRAEARAKTGPRGEFKYWDKGSLAVIGRARAVVEVGKIRFGGFFAWLFWACVHIAFLIGFRNRLGVMASWFWGWVLNVRDVRLITGDARVEVKTPRE